MGSVVLRRLTAMTGLSLAGALSLAIVTGAVAVAHDASEDARHRASRDEPAVGYKAAVLRRHSRSAVLYRSGEHRVGQISPTILRRADPQLDDAARHPCGTARARRACEGAPLRQAGLPESLLQVPSPATEQSLKQLGIPIVKDVYPIAILRSGLPNHEDDFAFERR
jgi:hypothetical protein